MLRTRVIPCLLLQGRGLLKTVGFGDPTYVGCPINAVRIFKEREVDELIFLDILAGKENKRPPFGIVSEIATECFMPFCYGGGIRSLEDIQKIFALGAEKIAIPDPVEFAVQMERMGAGELLLNSVDRDGTMQGYDIGFLAVTSRRVGMTSELCCKPPGEIFFQVRSNRIRPFSGNWSQAYQARHTATSHTS